MQFDQAYFGVRLGLLDQSLEDREDAGEPGLGGHEVPAAQALHPADHALGRGGETVARLVLALDVVLAQPRSLRGGPVVQVLGRLAGELVPTVGIPQAERDVVEAVDELLAAKVALVGPVKAAMKDEVASGAFWARGRDQPAWFSRSALIA